ncbi:trypsin-like peptidase domain-containing protein [Anabaena sp. UHCC 0253]|uniref:trypsin-like peptidase domain-containing protein n=1 Tax=Anabaena sp. UHCC 0253 TaxID=2590019 RepID=UPI001447CAD2|nr:trypsin-like peptidase domain-containing protein [Anabaena sp. UHCC 0253]MTJ54151.1 trypsin-like peptidase domain-containing protein [Anabaena sp. UHCC 0253]
MTNENHIEILKSAIARIYYKDSETVVGAGFLVSKHYLLTCAHVVTAALGILSNTQKEPDGIIEFDFPLIAPGEKVKAKVVFWRGLTGEKGEDIAGLQLEDIPPRQTNPVKLISTLDLNNHEFETFGFPEGYKNGRWSSGSIFREDGIKVIQMHAGDGFLVKPGYSGSAVWDKSLQAVVGMVVAVDNKQGARAVFMTPATVLVEAWNVLQQFVQTVTDTPIISKSNPRCRYYEGLLEQKKEELNAVLRQQGKVLADIDKLKLDRQAEDILKEIEDLESKIN